MELLKILADKRELQIVINTWNYVAVDNKYLPNHAFIETAVTGLAASFWFGSDKVGILPIAIGMKKLRQLSSGYPEKMGTGSGGNSFDPMAIGLKSY